MGKPCIAILEFIAADLTRANFSETKTSGLSNFNQTNLSGASFRFANVARSSFYQADMSNVDFRDADLSSAEGFGSFFKPKLGGARFNSKTKLPITKQEALTSGMIFSELFLKDRAVHPHSSLMVDKIF